MITLLSYFGSHVTLIFIVVLSVVALGALAWFTKNLKYVLGAVVLVIAGLAYQASNMDGYNRRLSEDNAATIKVLKTRILALSMLQAEDGKRAVSDAFLNSQLDALSRATPYNPMPCLDLPAARRVRAIGDLRSLKPNPAPLSPRRLTSLLQRRSGAP